MLTNTTHLTRADGLGGLLRLFRMIQSSRKQEAGGLRWGAKVRRLNANSPQTLVDKCRRTCVTWPARRRAIALAVMIGCGIGRAFGDDAKQGDRSAHIVGIESANASTSATDESAAPPTTPEQILNLDIEQLGDIQVRASAQATTGAPGTTLNVENLLDAAPATTGELLRDAPSVTLRRTSSINLDPRVRGYHSPQINANADGVTQLKTRIDIDSLFSQVDPGLVSQMTVIDGPYTSLYGPGYAFLSAELAAPPRYATPEVHGQSTLGQDSNGGNIAWQESLWGGGQDWGFYASYVQRSGSDYSAGGNSVDWRIPASYNAWNGYGAFSIDMTSRSRLDFSYLHSEQNNTELPGVVYDITNSSTSQWNARVVWQERRDEPERAVVQYWHTETEYYGNSLAPSKHLTFYDRFVTDNFLQFAPGAASVFAVTNTFANGGLSSDGVRALMNLGDPDLLWATVGADYRRYQLQHFEATLNLFGQSALIDRLPNPLLIPGFNQGAPDYRGVPKSSLDDFGLLTSLRTQWTGRVRTTAGGRVDFTSAEVDGGDPVASGSFFREVDTNPTPEEVLGMGYGTIEFLLGERCTVTSGVGYAMRNPSLDEYYSKFPSTPAIRFTSPMLGNSNLEPEKNLQFDLAISQTWENSWLSVRGFHSTIHDYILPTPLEFLGPLNPTFDLGRQIDLVSGTQAVPDSAIVLYQYANIERATLYGGDVSFGMNLTRWLILDGNLAYVKGTNHAPLVGQLVLPSGQTVIAPSTKGAEALPNIYPFAGTAVLRLVEPEDERYGFGVLVRAANGQDYIADGLGEVRTGGFFTMGLQGYWNFNDNVRVRSSITNLFDRTYTEHGSLAILNRLGEVTFVKDPGISWFTGLEVEF